MMWRSVRYEDRILDDRSAGVCLMQVSAGDGMCEEVVAKVICSCLQNGLRCTRLLNQRLTEVGRHASVVRILNKNLKNLRRISAAHIPSADPGDG